MKTLAQVVVLTTMSVGRLAAASATEPPCARQVGMLTTLFVYKARPSHLPRVEMRQCFPEGSATIQLVAWGSSNDAPALVFNTGDFGVVQAAARGNVFVIETGGATRDQVFVIVYDRGEPALALKRVTRGTARISIGVSAVDLIIEGVFAGDAPPRTESHRFDLKTDGMLYER